MALKYTIDGNLSDWGVDLSGNWSLNDTWVPNDGVKFIVEDNSNGEGVHIQGEGSNYTAFEEPPVQLYTGTWTYEPIGGEMYDVEAMYLDEDEYYIYIAIVTSVKPGGNPLPGDLALNLDGNETTGGYGFEYGIRLNPDYISAKQWHIYKTLTDNNWLIPTDVPMNRPGLLNEANPGTDIGTVDGDYNQTVNDNGKPNWVIEMAIPKDKIGMTGKNLPDEPLPKLIHHTDACGNDHIDFPIPEFLAIIIPAAMISFVAYVRNRIKK